MDLNEKVDEKFQTIKVIPNGVDNPFSKVKDELLINVEKLKQGAGKPFHVKDDMSSDLYDAIMNKFINKSVDIKGDIKKKWSLVDFPSFKNNKKVRMAYLEIFKMFT